MTNERTESFDGMDETVEAIVRDASGDVVPLPEKLKALYSLATGLSYLFGNVTKHYGQRAELWDQLPTLLEQYAKALRTIRFELLAPGQRKELTFEEKHWALLGSEMTFECETVAELLDDDAITAMRTAPPDESPLQQLSFEKRLAVRKLILRLDQFQMM